jgi:hypothetical protein
MLGRDRKEVVAEDREIPAQTALLLTILVALLFVTAASLFVLRFERGATGAEIRTGADELGAKPSSSTVE